ncbi:hypothetical protein, partial [Bacillus tropicus]|uniref:hypothetical protein n=1 Tax=Bacillus tropicus TaxID=2026188 RepID=UPI0021C06C76
IDKGTLQMLTEDEEIQEAVEKWMARGKYAKLLELWVKGLNVDWAKLYGDRPPKRMSLPSYPFAKDRYWIDISADAAVKRPAETQSAPIA